MQLEKDDTGSSRNNLPTLHVLIAYALVFIIFWAMPVIYRTIQVLQINESEIYIIGHTISISLQGLGIAIVWAVSVYGDFVKICCKQRHQKIEECSQIGIN